MKTNNLLRDLIVRLEKAGKKISQVWGRVAELLSRPTRKKVEINVGKLSRLVREGETVVVPGKVLGYGRMEKKVTVIALSFSRSALKKIEAAGGKAITLYEVDPEKYRPRVIV